MQKTNSFNLNQWEKSDRIMMEDFNADNAKLEAALNKIWDTFPLVKLMNQTLEEATTHTDLDLSGMDLTNYRLLRLSVRFPSSSIPAYYLALQVNGLSTGYQASDDESASVLNRIYVNKTMGSADAEIDVGLYLYCVNRSPIPTDQVTSLNLIGTNNLVDLSAPTMIPAGTKITLYGLKG